MPAPPSYPAAQALRVVLQQPQARRAGVGLAAALGASAASASWTPAALCSPASVAIAAEVSSGKPYIKKPTVFDPFGPVSLGQTALLAVLLPLQQNLDAAVRRFQDADAAGGVEGVTHDAEGKPLTPFALVDWDRLKVDAAYNMAKNLLNKTMCKAAQIALWHQLDGEGSQSSIAKIVKDVAASAERKCARADGGRLSAATAIPYSYLRAAVVGWLVFNLVEVGWTLTKLPQGRSMRDNQRGFMRLPLTLGSGAVGAAVGTLLWPGFGTGIGILAGEMAPDFFCPAVCGLP